MLCSSRKKISIFLVTYAALDINFRAGFWAVDVPFLLGDKEKPIGENVLYSIKHQQVFSQNQQVGNAQEELLQWHEANARK